MKFSRFPGFVLILASALLIGCGQKSAGPVALVTPAASGEDQLPFAREGNTRGISPTSTVIPPSARVPSGTPVTIHLLSSISSATAHSGDTFDAVLEEPMIVNGQILAERGTAVMGRVMEARRAGSDKSPGYLRVTLGSILLRGKSCAVRSSSSFIKAVFPHKANVAATKEMTIQGALRNAAAIEPDSTNPARVEGGDRTSVAVADVTLGPERHLTFRLTEPVPLPE
jgi:hypothetical protein